MKWIEFSDRRPKRKNGLTRHVFILSEREDNNISIWWGFYNPDRPKGVPPFKPKYWHYMHPLPGYAQTEAEAIEIEMKSDEESKE